MPPAPSGPPPRSRPFALVLGDQLSLDNPAIAEALAHGGSVLMIEAPGEARHVWSHKARIALFLAAMRRFADTLRANGVRVDYIDIDAPIAAPLAERLRGWLARHRPSALVVCEPGEYRVRETLERVCRETATPLDVRPDTHFIVPTRTFSRWAGSRKQWRMEFFYRDQRRATGILMDGDEPVGGRWNFDSENRKGFGSKGPAPRPAPVRFTPDPVTAEVIRTVGRLFADHPGDLDTFGWPTTREEALRALDDFVEHRLPGFGAHQDAMWGGDPFLSHSLLSPALNLKLLAPREVIDRALERHAAEPVPLASLEGFVRQILGWREFVRGIYWHTMPGLATANHFGHARELPGWFWTGATAMNCLRDAVGQTLRYGYAHHIQRLMVIGNFALLAGLAPSAVSDWFLAVYVDAVEWVELPNTAGMALYADGGRFTSKPYVASGAYVDRMSNHCRGCRYSPRERSGERACPITLLYWNFLDANERLLSSNPRTALMARNIVRLGDSDRRSLRREAGRVLSTLDRQ
ncbi:MAG: cryptochrome/photolyase family protein [Betaproteobacteria bacterium]|nr:cryptochrome/photolyase family protein [Betaproteobacteria bacterium]